MADLDVDLPEWGFTASPYILDRQLILEAGRVVSYDKLSGDVLWKTPRHAAGYGSAISFQHAGQTLLATLDCDALRVVTADSGKEIDSIPWDSPFRTNSTTPIVRDGFIYISTGYNVGCGLFQLQDGRLRQRYTSRKMRNHFQQQHLVPRSPLRLRRQLEPGKNRAVDMHELPHGRSCLATARDGLRLAHDRRWETADSQRGRPVGARPGHAREVSRAGTISLADRAGAGRSRCCSTVLLYARNAAGDLVCADLRVGQR